MLLLVNYTKKIFSQDVDIIEKLESLDIIKHLSELVIQGAFDIRKGVSDTV